MARAEHVAHWVATFAPGVPFRAVVVEYGGRACAALPLVERRRWNRLRWGALPVNDWSTGGDLLLDGESPVEVVLDRLVEGLSRLPWPLWSVTEVDLSAPSWSALLSALGRQHVAHDSAPRYLSGRVQIAATWPEYLATRTKKHRHNLRRNWGRLKSNGPTRHEYFRQVSPALLESLLVRGFTVENRGWKGRAGSSVLGTPGMFEFFLAQAELLNAEGQLRLGFLEHLDEAIAFDYGYVADGVFYRSKIGYDERFAAYSPGQLLFQQELEHFHAELRKEAVDFLGPLNEALDKWVTETYQVSRLVVAAPGWRGRMALAGYLAARKLRSTCRRSAAKARAFGPVRPATTPPRAEQVPSEGTLARESAPELPVELVPCES